MPGLVLSADDHAFCVPSQFRSYARWTITQRQTAAPPLGLVWFRTMQQQVAMNRNLSRLEFVIVPFARSKAHGSRRYKAVHGDIAGPCERSGGARRRKLVSYPPACGNFPRGRS